MTLYTGPEPSDALTPFCTAQLALAGLLVQQPFIVPIPGTTKTAHLDENISAAAITFTQEEYEAHEEKALEIIGFGAQAAFTIPFIDAMVDDETRAHLMGTAPLPVKVILRLFRGRYARMAARALGEGV